MTQSALYREPVLLDSVAHRQKRLLPLVDFSITASMHAVFIAATEFPQAALAYPSIFVPTSEPDANGKFDISPVALMGLVPQENLQVEGQQWTGRYLPAFIRRFPFLAGPVQGQAEPGVYLDVAWPGVSETEGEPLFEADGKTAPALQRALEFVQAFENEAQRTRAFCERVQELDILQPMKADATLPNGETLVIDGFLSVNEEKFNALPDATIVELHRSGVLMLLQFHLLSLNTMGDLVQRKAKLVAAQIEAAPASA